MPNVIIKPDGGIEGDAADLVNIFQQKDSKLKDYITNNLAPIKRKHIHVGWLIGVGLLFLILNCILWCQALNPAIYKITILTSLLIICIATIMLQYNYNNWILSILATFFGLTIMAVSLSYITPKEAIDKLSNQATVKPSTDSP